MGYPHVFDGLQAQHAATLELLAEVRDYLMRLAPVPLTKELCAKIRAHIDEPSRTVAHAAAAREAAPQTKLTGVCIRRWGAPAYAGNDGEHSGVAHCDTEVKGRRSGRNQDAAHWLATVADDWAQGACAKAPLTGAKQQQQAISVR